ncbi:Uncharacterised protein [Mycobacteroides abscessus subsp. abscessus]|nr:Uncharacterised protein [Mycobacteroides abscessus subsp. abscessus]
MGAGSQAFGILAEAVTAITDRSFSLAPGSGTVKRRLSR